MRTVLSLFCLIASASAFAITFPTASQGWTNSGPQKVVWTTGGGDPANFTLVLINKAQNVNQVLDALVVSSLGNETTNPPAEGWPTGSGFRLGFAPDSENTDTLLAQSDEFSISPPPPDNSTTSTTDSPTSAFTPASSLTTPATTSAPTTSTTTGNGSSAGVSEFHISMACFVAAFAAGVVNFL